MLVLIQCPGWTVNSYSIKRVWCLWGKMVTVPSKAFPQVAVKTAGVRVPVLVVL